MTPGNTLAAAARAARRPASLAALALLCALGTRPAAADWLVTRDGARIEIEGPWEVRGKLVVFELPTGRLSSLRLSAVDLEASDRATAEAASGPAEQAAEDRPARPQEAVFVLTDEDVGHVGPGTSSAAADQAETGPGDRGDETARDPVEVISWEEATGEDGIVVTGTASNNGDAVAAGLSLSVVLYDLEGRVLATGDAQLGASALPPGQSTSFRASFPAVFAFAAVRFDFHYQPLRTQTNPPPPGSTRSDG